MMDAIICQAEAHMEQWGKARIEPQLEAATDDTTI
jgi:hypothetical protein